MYRSLRVLAVAACAVALAASAFAQPIQQIRGQDARVDYASLTKFGPWDDRNYELTQEDIKLFAPNEDELRIAIPAWYRVELRKGIPDMLREGPAQYPHSALPAYRIDYGGYLVNGKIYKAAERRDGRFHVLMEKGIDRKEWEAEKAELDAKFLTGEVRVTSPNGAAESAIKINPVNTNIVIAGSNGPGSGQIMHYSSDGGDSWNTSAALPGGGTCCDPTVDYSSDGTLAYTATLGNCGGGGCQIWFYRSSDNGQTWNDLSGSPARRTLNTGGGNDKEFLHVDKFATSPFKDNIYATWHASNIMQFSVSSDFGNTWSTQAFSSANDQRGIGSDITTDKSGAVYYIWPAFNSQRILLAKSTNGGSSFGAPTEIASTEASFTFPVPSMETRDVFVYASADTDFSNGTYGDSIYVAWTDSTGATGSAANNHARIQVAYSRDGGSTWNISTPHETADANSVDRYHQWLAVDANGRVHIMFYDTRRSSNRTAVDVFYSFSDDGAQTWSTPSRVTAEQSPNIADGFEFGDYNGLDAVMNDVIAIYTDNRNEGGGGGDSVDVYAAGLQSGPSNAVPMVNITAPADGTTVDVGTSVSFSGTATDAEDGNLTSSLAWTSSLDGAIGSGGSFSTSSLSLGAHTITASATDSASQTGSASITLTINDPNSNGPQTAVYDAGLGAPRCSVAGSSCDSTTLLDSRSANLSPAEPNQPNTLDGCTDGTSGSYHSDESGDRIVVSTLDGSDFVEGATVEIEATVWAWTTPSEDSLDLYYAADANNPSWVFIATLQPSVAGGQTLSTTYTLPTGTLQAVRASFRYQGSAAPCSTGNFDDADDLVFAVASGGGNTAPSVNITAPADGSTVTQGSSVAFSGGANDAEDGDISASLAWTSSLDGSIGSGASFSTSSLSLGTHTITAAVTDSGGLSGSDAITLTVDVVPNNPPSVNITAPASGSSFDEGTNVTFTGTATDAEDGTITGSIAWSSSLDGALGNGGSVSSSTLSVGVHTITASVTDSGGAPGSDTISVTINSVGGCSDCVDFSTTGTVSYATQDADSNVAVEDGGDTLALFDNTWRRTTATYNVTANTVLEFEFSSSAQGEIHGIGFEEDDNISNAERIFQLYGTQNWGSANQDFDNYAGGGAFTTYTIPVGTYYTGNGLFLAFVNDNDAGSGNDSRFRNVRIYETAPPACTVDEDFESGSAGWVNDAASTCTTGDYVLGNPTNPGGGQQIVGSNSGVNSLFTGVNTSAGNADVDGGNCILNSPTWSVTAASTLSVAYWHGQRDANDDASGDFFLLEYSTNGGTSWNTLASNGDSASTAAWTNANAAIPAGSNVQLRVQCSDGAGPGDLVECGIDDVSICE